MKGQIEPNGELTSIINFCTFEEINIILKKPFIITDLSDQLVACRYYSREFIFWAIIKYLYIFFQNEKIVLIIFNLLVSLLTYASVSQIEKFAKSNKWIGNDVYFNYLRFLIIILFPFIFGMNVVLRQHLSMAFSLFAFSLILNSSFIRSFFFYLLSIFTHNGALILLPLFIKNKSKVLGFFSISTFIMVLLFYLPSLSQEKFGIYMGIIYSYGFLFALLLITSFIFLLSKFQMNFRNHKFSAIFLNYLLLSGIVLSAIVFLVPGNQFHRLSYFYLVIIFFILSLFFEIFTKNKIYYRIFLIISAFALHQFYHPLYQ